VIEEPGVEMVGEAAVDRSVQEKVLSEAAAPAMAPTMIPGFAGGTTDEWGNAVNPVRYAGDKTFILHEGVWTDTAFDPDKMETVPVSFGSDDYFALIAARPERGRYYAIGDHVVVVVEDTAYEVREGDAPALDLPEPGGDGESPSEAQQQESVDSPNIFEAIIEAIVEFVEGIVSSFSQ
jgi:hypothetical protein